MKAFSSRTFGRVPALLGMLLSSAAFALPQPQAASAAPKKCLMWKAVNGNKTVYLLGSIHLGSKKMYPLPKPIEDAYSKSKVLVVEVNINKTDQSEAMSFVTANGMYQGGDSLWKHLSAKTGDKVKSFCKQYDMNPDLLGMFKPWLASVELEVLPMQKAGMDLTLGIDKYFLDKASAKSGSKPIVELENANFQLKLLSSLPENLADDYISFSLGESASSVSEDSKLEKLWMAGDADALNSAISKNPPKLTKLMRAIREDRNPHMADVAEKYLKGDGACFFVVGAAHLIGKEGVVALLQKRGYTVSQVTANP